MAKPKSNKTKSEQKKAKAINKKESPKKPNGSKKSDALQIQLDELKDKHLRLKAEFENFRRRKAEEISRLLQYEGENVIIGFLPIVDDLERMIDSSDSSDKLLKDGINKAILTATIAFINATKRFDKLEAFNIT